MCSSSRHRPVGAVWAFVAAVAFSLTPASLSAQAAGADADIDPEAESPPADGADPVADEVAAAHGSEVDSGPDGVGASDANDPDVGAETPEEHAAASRVVPGAPVWMTPELRTVLDDPAQAAAVRRYLRHPTLEWEPQWSTFGWADGAVLGGLAVVGLIGQFASSPETPRWTGGIAGDDGIRDAMALDSFDDREGAATLSDDLLALLLIYPLLVDGVIMALLVHDAPTAASEMMLVDTLAYALTFAIVNVTKKSVGRERPFVQECAGNPEYAHGCNADDRSRNASFVSGHSAFAFTAAGLMCAHHVNLPIHGDALADGAVCASGLAAATGVALLRIAADRHWASDVYSGAAVGLLVGWLMPTLLRYQSWNPLPNNENVRMVPTPQMGPGQFGLGVTGIF